MCIAKASFTLCKKIDPVHQPYAHAMLDYSKAGGFANVTVKVASHLQHGLRHLMRDQLPDALLTKISGQMTIYSNQVQVWKTNLSMYGNS